MAQGKSEKRDQRAAGEFDVYVGQRVRETRNLRDISQTDLGIAIGVSFQQIQKYEKGVNRIAPKRLADIAHHLGCKTSSLLPPDKPRNGNATMSEGAVAMEDIRTMIRSPVAMRMIRAYLKLESPKARAAMAQLAEELSQL